MYYAPANFYNDGQSRGHLPWSEVQRQRRVQPRLDPTRDYIDVSAPSDLGRATMRQVIDATLRASGLTAGELVGPTRYRRVMVVRHASWRVARKWTTCSLTQIGKLWRRDHTTIISGLKKVAKYPHVYAGIVAAIERELACVNSLENPRQPMKPECENAARMLT